MFTVKTLNKIAAIGTNRLDKAYFTIDDATETPDAIIVRSAKMADYPLNPELACIARAGAGYNNIPTDKCADAGIVVFNTPGANANGVKELVICAMLLASRKVVNGINWVKTIADKGDEVAALVEKGKSEFTGPEIMGKTLGLIGLGAIGAKVAKAAKALGMTVYGYDPFLSDALKADLEGYVTIVATLDEIYAAADYISLHVPCNDSTKNTVCATSIAKMKDGVRIVNIARGELVNDDDILAALETGKVAAYVTDFPDGKLAASDKVIAIPHLGASTPESEDNCAIMAADQISEYMLRGNIVNSVNLPNISLEKSGAARTVIIRKADVELTALLNAVAAAGAKVTGSADKTRGVYAAAIIDTDTPITADAFAAIDGILKVRTI